MEWGIGEGLAKMRWLLLGTRWAMCTGRRKTLLRTSYNVVYTKSQHLRFITQSFPILLTFSIWPCDLFPFLFHAFAVSFEGPWLCSVTVSGLEERVQQAGRWSGLEMEGEKYGAVFYRGVVLQGRSSYPQFPCSARSQQT